MRIGSEVVANIHGANLIMYEHYSHGSIEKIIDVAGTEYGVVFHEKCRSRCG